MTIISTGDPRTFDPELQAIFDASKNLIEAYYEHDAELAADRRAGGLRYITDPNPAADAYIRFREDLGRHFGAEPCAAGIIRGLRTMSLRISGPMA